MPRRELLHSPYFQDFPQQMCLREATLGRYDTDVTVAAGARNSAATMQCTYSIHPEENLVRSRVAGDITVAGLIELVTQVSKDPAFRAGMNTVADLRESSGSWDFSEVQRYRDFLRHIAGDSTRRWGIVVKPGALAGVMHVLILISQSISHRIQMQLFEDVHAALRWATAAPQGCDVREESEECPGSI